MNADISFTLTSEERDRVLAAHFDPDALEQLLRRFPATDRRTALRPFLRENQPASTLNADGTTRLPDVSVLESISNPELQELLDQVWAPRWRRFSLERLEQIKGNPPGLRLALEEARHKERGGDR